MLSREQEGPATAHGRGVGVAPNRSLGQCRISFDVQAPRRVIASLYDIGGCFVRRPFEGAVGTGFMYLDWDDWDARGKTVAQGVYFADLSPPQAGSLSG
jgi:hypothetical protein